MKESLVIHRITLNRPDRKNAIDASFLEQLRAANADDSVRVVLIEATGTVFCCGADPDLPPEVWRFRDWMTKPVVCAVQGAALSEGVALLANSHVVVAAQGSSFGLVEVREGRWPLGFPAIASAIGERRATELALTGRVFGTNDALQMGLVQEVAPAFEYDDRAEALAAHLAGLDLTGRLPIS